MTDAQNLKARLGILREFLHGAGELDGRWFGETHRPAFWWRRHLRDIDLAIARISILETEVRKLKGGEYVRVVPASEDAGDDARISAASRREWAERAWAAETERDELKAKLQLFKSGLTRPEVSDLNKAPLE